MTDRDADDPEEPDPDALDDPFTRQGGNGDVEDGRFERMDPEDEVDPFAALDADDPAEGHDGSDASGDVGGSDDPDGDGPDDDLDAYDDLDAHDGSDARDDADPHGVSMDGSFGVTTGSEPVDDDVDPFAELDDSPDPDAPPGSVGDPFERMEVEEVDMDEVWDALDDDTDLPPADSPEAPGPDTRSDDVVDKRVYCQRCPHFAEPPETACTLDDTDIVEVIGFDEFRLRGCPMVSEDGPTFDRSR